MKGSALLHGSPVSRGPQRSQAILQKSLKSPSSVLHEGGEGGFNVIRSGYDLTRADGLRPGLPMRKGRPISSSSFVENSIELSGGVAANVTIH